MKRPCHRRLLHQTSTSSTLRESFAIAPFFLAMSGSCSLKRVHRRPLLLSKRISLSPAPAPQEGFIGNAGSCSPREFQRLTRSSRRRVPTFTQYRFQTFTLYHFTCSPSRRHGIIRSLSLFSGKKVAFGSVQPFHFRCSYLSSRPGSPLRRYRDVAGFLQRILAFVPLLLSSFRREWGRVSNIPLLGWPWFNLTYWLLVCGRNIGFLKN